LKKAGIVRVRPLEGGFNVWLERGYPVEPFSIERREQIA
jgi:hypothetical protein